jgi:hypothetical protein
MSLSALSRRNGFKERAWATTNSVNEACDKICDRRQNNINCFSECQAQKIEELVRSNYDRNYTEAATPGEKAARKERVEDELRELRYLKEEPRFQKALAEYRKEYRGHTMPEFEGGRKNRRSTRKNRRSGKSRKVRHTRHR